MYNPTRDQARQFFIEAWRKHREHLPLTELEVIAADLFLAFALAVWISAANASRSASCAP